MKLLLTAFIYLFLKVSGDDDTGWSLVGNPLVTVHPCTGSTGIKVLYEPARSPVKENQYDLWIHKKFPKYSVIKLKFDKGTIVKLTNNTFARIDLEESEEHSFKIRFFESHVGIGFHVQGCDVGVVPYIQSVIINTKEYCQESQMGFLDSYIEGYKDQAQSSCTNQQQHRHKNNIHCGRSQTLSDVVRVNGESQRRAWPWHTAIYKKRISGYRYLCGGTLISEKHVLTVANCVSRRGYDINTFITNPKDFKVLLGKHNLPEVSEIGAEEKEVEEIIIHERFISNLEIFLENDIALMKLKTKVTFTEFIQPACLWYDNAHNKLGPELSRGTIVGWGYDENNKISKKLSQVQIQMIPDDICIENKPEFYTRLLNGKRFCAGDLKEAVACNGDNGGGFHVFIPDDVENSTSGTWYIRGIISLFLASDNDISCSNDHYTVFTDVGKYTDWISSHL